MTESAESIEAGEVEYKRPLSNADIVQKFRIEASIDEALQNANYIRFKEGQRLDLGSYTKYDNFILDGRDIISTYDFDNLMYVLDQYSSQIYGLRIPGCRLEESYIDAIVRFLTDHGRFQYLVEIDLSYVPLSPKSIKWLCDYLDPAVSGYCPLKRVQLCHCSLQHFGSQQIFSAVRANVFVNELNLSGNHASDNSCNAIMKCLQNPENNFHALSLAENNISLEGLKVICPPLSRHNSLRTLTLNSNYIGDAGASVIVRSLKLSKSIEELNLSNCGLVQCKWGRHLKHISSLHSLNVSCNDINDFGCLLLCNGLQECPSLRHVNLSNNQFGGPSCAGLGALLELNGGLYTLNLSYSVISRDVWVSIAAGLACNTTLQLLDIRWCNINIELAAILCEALEINEICTVDLSYNPLPENLLVDCRSHTNQLRRPLQSKVNRRHGKSSRGHTSDLILISQREETVPIDEKKTVTFSELGDGSRNNPLEILANVSGETEQSRPVSKHGRKSTAVVDESLFIKQMPLHPNYQTMSMSAGENWREDAQAKLTLSLAVLEFDDVGNKLVVQDENEEDGLDLAMKDEHIRIVYGNFQEEIGVIRIHGGTTYEQTKDLVRPLIIQYMGSVDATTPSMQDLLQNFTFINHKGEVIDGKSLKSRCVLPDVIKNKHTLIIRPGNWLSLPEESDVLVGQYESI